MKPGDLVRVWTGPGVWQNAILIRERIGGKAGTGFDYQFDPRPTRREEWEPLPSIGGWASPNCIKPREEIR